MNHKPNYQPQHIKGFSLIEFLVASVLSMIVLVAVGSGYFAARRMNDVALARLTVQQDLRNASNMIVRDARMAGSFGCFNMSNSGATIASDGNDANSLLKLTQTATGGSTTIQTAVKEVAANQFNINGFVPSANSPALMFQYGTGSAAVVASGANTATLHIPANDPLANLNANMPIVISSCNVLDRPSSFTYQNGNLTNITPTLSPNQAISQMSILRYNANVYLIGHPNGSNINGLYRFQLGDNGNWVGPQLLMNNVNNMAVHFTYVRSCPDAGSANATEHFETSNNLDTSESAVTPAQVRIVLNGNSVAAEGKLGSASDREAGTVNIYNIDATVRGGNTCADRSV